MQYARHFALMLLLATRVIVSAQDELIPFGSAFAPTMTFTESYRQSVKYSAADDDYLDQTSSQLSFKARVSTNGLDLSTLDDESTVAVDIGNLSLSLAFGDGTRSVVDGMNVVRWQLDGTDPDTGDSVVNACTVTLRYNATEAILQVANSNTPDDFNIMAPDEAGTPETVQSVPLSFDFEIGPYGFTDRICYVSGTSSLYNTTVNGEEFTDLANVKLSGEIDSENPVVKITSPAASAIVDNDTIEVHGAATDNYGATSVSVSINGGPFTPAILDQDGAWHLSNVVLVAGANTLVARALDEAGNSDDSAPRTVTYVPHGNLSVTAEGNASGKVAGAVIATLDYNPSAHSSSVGAILPIGKQFTLTATAGTDAIFDHWSSNVPLSPEQAASSKLVFTMSDGLVLTAHFTINPFTPIQGRYSGLISSAGSGDAGFLTGTLGAQGAFSLRAQWGGFKLPIKGRFGLDGQVRRTISLNGISYVIDLTLNISDNGTRNIAGTITGGGTSVSLNAELSPFRKGGTRIAQEIKGSYNFLVPPAADQTDANYPIGIGFGSASVSSAGLAKFVGKLADGTAVSGGAPLSGESRCPLFVRLYKGKGSVGGWIKFDPTQTNHDLSGTLTWIKSPGLGTAGRSAGFSGESDLVGAKLGKSSAHTAGFLANTNGAGQFTLQSASLDPLPLNVTFPAHIQAGGKITITPTSGSPIQSVTCTYKPKTGLLTGTILEFGVARKLQGMFISNKLNMAGGFLLRNGYSAAFAITPDAAQ